MLCLKGVLEICSKGEHPCRSAISIHLLLPMSKCDFNKVALQLYWNCTSTWVFSCKFAAYFQDTFSQEHLWMAASEDCMIMVLFGKLSKHLWRLELLMFSLSWVGQTTIKCKILWEFFREGESKNTYLPSDPLLSIKMFRVSVPYIFLNIVLRERVENLKYPFP